MPEARETASSVRPVLLDYGETETEKCYRWSAGQSFLLRQLSRNLNNDIRILRSSTIAKSQLAFTTTTRSLPDTSKYRQNGRHVHYCRKASRLSRCMFLELLSSSCFAGCGNSLTFQTARYGHTRSHVRWLSSSSQRWREEGSNYSSYKCDEQGRREIHSVRPPASDWP